MKVYVILSDCGLNGPWVHGVRSTEPDDDEIQRWAGEVHTNLAPYAIASVTGYNSTYVLEFEVDGVLE